eukprot:gene2772-4329_t
MILLTSAVAELRKQLLLLIESEGDVSTEESVGMGQETREWGHVQLSIEEVLAPAYDQDAVNPIPLLDMTPAEGLREAAQLLTIPPSSKRLFSALLQKREADWLVADCVWAMLLTLHDHSAHVLNGWNTAGAADSSGEATPAGADNNSNPDDAWQDSETWQAIEAGFSDLANGEGLQRPDFRRLLESIRYPCLRRGQLEQTLAALNPPDDRRAETACAGASCRGFAPQRPAALWDVLAGGKPAGENAEPRRPCCRPSCAASARGAAQPRVPAGSLGASKGGSAGAESVGETDAAAGGANVVHLASLDEAMRTPRIGEAGELEKGAAFQARLARISRHAGCLLFSVPLSVRDVVTPVLCETVSLCVYRVLTRFLVASATCNPTDRRVRRFIKQTVSLWLTGMPVTRAEVDSAGWLGIASHSTGARVYKTLGIQLDFGDTVGSAKGEATSRNLFNTPATAPSPPHGTPVDPSSRVRHTLSVRKRIYEKLFGRDRSQEPSGGGRAFSDAAGTRGGQLVPDSQIAGPVLVPYVSLLEKAQRTGPDCWDWADTLDGLFPAGHQQIPAATEKDGREPKVDEAQAELVPDSWKALDALRRDMQHVYNSGKKRFIVYNKDNSVVGGCAVSAAAGEDRGGKKTPRRARFGPPPDPAFSRRFYHDASAGGLSSRRSGGKSASGGARPLPFFLPANRMLHTSEFGLSVNSPSFRLLAEQAGLTIGPPSAHRHAKDK